MTSPLSQGCSNSATSSHARTFLLASVQNISWLSFLLSLYYYYLSGDSDSKDLPAMPQTRGQSLGQEDPLEKGMATRSHMLV